MTQPIQKRHNHDLLFLFLCKGSIHICSMILAIYSILGMSYRLLTYLQSVFNISHKFCLCLTGFLLTYYLYLTHPRNFTYVS